MEALDRVGWGHAQAGLTVVETGAEAVGVNFAGSPTILVDGRDQDLVSRRTWRAGLCSTSAGLAGAPPVEELVGSLRERSAG